MNENIEMPSKWILPHWFYIVIAVLLVLLLIMIVTIYAVSYKSGNQFFIHGEPYGWDKKPDNTQTTSLNIPIGSVVAWHKNAFNKIQKLPDGWVECNGQSISVDKDGPLANSDGVFKVPDLNNTPTGYFGGGRFLRGSNKSGDYQDGTFIFGITETGASLDLYTGIHKSWQPGSFDADAVISGTSDSGRLLLITTYQREHTRPAGYRPRPLNMSVVWIIRVK
ncbi:MAG: tail fiber protein [Candidatus Competibacter sp.]|nr:tail fiber protein [Candidatus Competibacter sp.]